MIPSVVVGAALALANSQQQLKLLSFTLFIKDRKTVFHNQITLIYQSGIRQLSKKKKKHLVWTTQELIHTPGLVFTPRPVATH